MVCGDMMDLPTHKAQGARAYGTSRNGTQQPPLRVQSRSTHATRAMTGACVAVEPLVS